MTVSDEDLMQRTTRGDPEGLAALGELFDRHHASLHGFLRRFLGEAAAAEDVVQEVFIRVWKHRSTFAPGSTFSAWLYAIARNAAMDEIRKRGKRPRSFTDLDAGSEGAELGGESAGPGADAEVWRLTVREQVQRALQELPADQRLCLVLKEYEGKSHREIAEILGCTEGNARVMAHRARLAMRRLLQPLLQPAEVRKTESEGSCV